MRSTSIEKICIKPTLRCTACCPGCAFRLQFYERRNSDDVLQLALWKQIISDASSLGAKRVIISGGEPTLYPYLTELVKFASEQGMTSKLNTNGSCVSPELASRLARAGLSEAMISIYSHDPLLHDKIRQERGLFARATRAVSLLREQSSIIVGLQTVLANHNLLYLDALLKMSYHMRIAYLQTSYVEGGSSNWLPSSSKIHRFQREVIPRMVKVIEQAGRKHAEIAICLSEQLFAGRGERIYEFSIGSYFPDCKPACRRPWSYSIILANGDVLPCNGAEYSHGPLMGNLRSASLVNLWQSESWQTFRRNRHDWCHRCPVMLHSRIPLT